MPEHEVIRAPDGSSNDHQTIWNSYLSQKGDASLYHKAEWQRVITTAYGHAPLFFLATQCNADVGVTLLGEGDKAQHPDSGITPRSGRLSGRKTHGLPVVGVLPVIQLKSMLFGNTLFSMPFFDMGGVVADSTQVESDLLAAVVEIGSKRRVGAIELRQTQPLSCLEENHGKDLPGHPRVSVRHDKVRMLLKLPPSAQELMQSFKSKLRSQIRKPSKEGLYAEVGGKGLIDDFYRVFSINMRDLGSPVHSKLLFRAVLDEFSDEARIVMVYRDREPMAGSLVIGFKSVLENPWASSLRKYSRLSPNMLLYWAMLEYACDHGYQYFDFGRSTPSEGTFKFKEQWGASPHQLYWYTIHLKNSDKNENAIKKSKFDRAIEYWKQLPLPVANFIGPKIRKYIGL